MSWIVLCYIYFFAHVGFYCVLKKAFDESIPRAWCMQVNLPELLYNVSETITILFCFHPCLVPHFISRFLLWDTLVSVIAAGFGLCGRLHVIWIYLLLILSESRPRLAADARRTDGFNGRAALKATRQRAVGSFAETRGYAGALENYLAVLVNQVSVWVSLLIGGSSCWYMADVPDRQTFPCWRCLFTPLVVFGTQLFRRGAGNLHL